MQAKNSNSHWQAHPVVFPVAGGIIMLFVLLGVIVPERVAEAFDSLQKSITTNFGWLYIVSMTGFLGFAIWLACSRYGTIKLGADTDEPEFSTLTWFAMLFSAGMGIGLLFWSVAEPLYHYNDPVITVGSSFEQARQSMGLTIFHWGLHPWALYAVVALALAYFGFRRGLPLSFRSVFFPLLGNRIHGRLGDMVDVLAIVATLFGVATSLGLGAMQVNAGLNHLLGVEQSTTVQILLIAGITAIATISVCTGLDVGIRRLSEANIGLALLLLLFVFLVGPTVFFLSGMVENVGTYLQRLPTHAFWTGTFEDNEDMTGWLGGWTVFYWGWWIAWSPFVGMFIARVSKGRTIRQFIVGVLVVPTLVSIVWLTIFGSGVLHQELYPEQYQAGVYPVKHIEDLDGASLAVAADDENVFVGPNLGQFRLLEDGTLQSAGGQAVVVEDGVLMIAGTEKKFTPIPGNTFSGPLLTDPTPLTPAKYLAAPVLTTDHTQSADKIATSMFVMLSALPWGGITAALATICIVLFFVTSSDSASMVIDIIASGGNQDPPIATRLFWAMLEGVVGAVLLLAGGLQALQTASITAALPFTFVILLMCYSLVRGLANEKAGLVPPDQVRHMRTGSSAKVPASDASASAGAGAK